MRRSIRGLAFILVLMVGQTPGAFTSPADAAESVAQENAKPGTTDWRLTKVSCAGCPENVTFTGSWNGRSAQDLYGGVEIQGYASRASVDHNESINFFVSTASETDYTLSIYRLGWYGGTGGRLVQAPVPLHGTRQSVPAPDATGLVECRWPAAYLLTIPPDWVSGIYVAKLEESTTHFQNYILFVVRDDQRNSPYLYMTSDTTYQAYNEWGGGSLYTANGIYPAGKNAWRVSYNRPYWRGGGSGDFLSYEVNMVRWLERQGYDVTYLTAADAHGAPDLLIDHAALIMAGHSEYWSWQMRANVERARDRGVSLGFFVGGSMLWQIRFEPDSSGQVDRTVVGYKEDALGTVSKARDPYYVPMRSDGTMPRSDKERYVTTFWSTAGKGAGQDPINRPEEALVGVEYAQLSDHTPQDIVLTDPASWPSWLSQDTGLSAAAVLRRILGYEVDRMREYFPIGTSKIAHSTFKKFDASGGIKMQGPADATLYTAPSGATVFATGSVYWDLGLSDYGMNAGDWGGHSKGEVPGAQKITANFLAHALQTARVPTTARLAATISTNASAAGYPATNANDGSLDTQWVASLQPSDTNNRAWIQLDLGTRKWVHRLRWQGPWGTPYPASTPANYSVEISDDGVYWQTVIVRTYGAPVPTGDELVNEQARYVRLVSTQVGDGTGWALSFYEFWAEGAAPPPSGRLRALASAASSQGSYTSTQWVANLSSSANNNYAWYQVDLGNRKHIDRVRWIGGSGSPYPASSPTNYSIQVSDNATVWRTVITRTNSSAVVEGNEALSAAGRYVRLVTSKVGDGTGWALSFYHFWVEGSDSSNVLAAIPSASAQAYGFSASNASDWRSATPWVANLTPTAANNNAWFLLDFGSRKQIDRVRWIGGDGEPYPASSPTDYVIQVSDDGSLWREVSSHTGSGPVTSGNELVNCRGRFLRLVSTKVNDGSGWSLSFAEFWAEGF